MPTRLFNLSLKRISVVDDGDNPDAEIMLIKRRDKTIKDKDLTDMDKDKDLELTDEQRAEIAAEAVEKAKAEADVELKKLQDEIKALKESQESDVAKRVAKAEAELKETREALAKKMDADAETAVFAKMKTWDCVPDLKTDDPEVAKALKAVRKSAPGHAEVLEGMIDRCNKALSESALLTVKGSDHAAGGKAEVELNAKAAEIQKAHDGMSWPDALVKAMDDNPEITKRYMKEYAAEDERVRSEAERGI